MNKTFKLSLILFLHLTTQASNFEQIWRDMQKCYTFLRKETNGTDIPKKMLYHPQWQNFGLKIDNLINGKPNKHFLKNATIAGTMVRSGMNIGQTYEICFLNQCIRPETRQLLKKFNEPSHLGLQKECREWQCSSNTLGQLFYAGRILERINHNNIDSIIELGAGFGALAHIFKSAAPNVNYYIIDLPELLAIQYLYLNVSMPDEDIHIHTQTNSPDLAKKGIHLIPIHIAHKLNLDTSIFISNFALSEATYYVQELIAQKKFFNASMVYLTGQLEGWGKFGFEVEDQVFSAVRQQFDQVTCQPFHLLLSSLKSYEIIATRM